MAQTFNCPNCGAPLDYKGSDPIIRCPYCSGSVIVPENLRAKPSFSKKPDNFTLVGGGGAGNLGGLLNQARQLKEVKDLAEAGEMDNAVTLYMEITGEDEVRARTAVNKLASGQPITMAGFSAADVAAQVRMASAQNVQVNVDEAIKTARSVSKAVGCFVAILVLGIMAAVLIPVGAVLIGLNNELGIVDTNLGIDLGNSGIENVLPIAGFASQKLSFGGEGTGPGLFDDARNIAVSSTGENIYVADFDTGRVQAFDASGNFITQWIIQGENDPYISDLDVDRQGNVYVTVYGDIMKFNSTGNLIETISGPEVSNNYDSLSILPDGRMLVMDWGRDLVFLNADGEVTNTIKDVVSEVSGDSELSGKLAVDGLGNIYIMAPFNNAVFKYDADGKFINRFGSDGDEPGQFRAMQDIAVDSQGHIFITDIHGVSVFDSDGRFINSFKVSYTGYDIAVDDAGFVYVITNQWMVEKYQIDYSK